MSISIVLAALAMGFFGSPHCLGMCGGVVAAFGISMQHLSPAKRQLLIITYHIGRLASYVLLGLVAAILGSQVIAPLLTNNDLPRIVVGLSLVFVALLMLGLPVLNRLEKVGLKLWQTLSPLRQKVLPIDSLPKALGAGLMWGFLPCGLVYGALVMAISLAANDAKITTSLVFMTLFWLGTLPMLLATSTMIAWLQRTVAKFSLRKFSGALMLLSGLAIAFSPIVMHHMHGDHHGHMHGDHANHAHHSDHSDHANHDHTNHHSHDHSNHAHGNHADHSNHDNHGDHSHHH